MKKLPQSIGESLAEARQSCAMSSNSPASLTALEAGARRRLVQHGGRTRRVRLVMVSDRLVGLATNTLEKRVGVLPSQLDQLRVFLTRLGIESDLLVVSGAGHRAGFSNADYIGVGAEIVDWWELEHLDEAPDVVHGLKEPSGLEVAIRAPFMRIGALHTGDTCGSSPFLDLVARGVTILDGSHIGSGRRIPIRGAMSDYAGRNAAEQVLLDGSAERVIVWGVGRVGQAAAATLLKEKGTKELVLVETSDRPDFLAELRARYAADARVTVLDEAQVRKQGSFWGATALILGVAYPAKRAPRVVEHRELADMAPGALVIDVSIDEGGAIDAPGLDESLPLAQIVAKTRKALEPLGLRYRATPNMPRAYPRAASEVHGEAILPYLAALLVLCATSDDHQDAVSTLAEWSDADAAEDVFNRCLGDLRNGLAFAALRPQTKEGPAAGGGAGADEPTVTRVRVGQIASKEWIASYLGQRGISVVDGAAKG
jgi:alanine dehydrogenase